MPAQPSIKDALQKAVDATIRDMCLRMGFKPFPVSVGLLRGTKYFGTCTEIAIHKSRTDMRVVGYEYEIKINLALMRTLSDSDQNEAIVHECAHAVVAKYVRGGMRGVREHGPAWRALMKLYVPGEPRTCMKGWSR